MTEHLKNVQQELTHTQVKKHFFLSNSFFFGTCYSLIWMYFCAGSVQGCREANGVRGTLQSLGWKRDRTFASGDFPAAEWADIAAREEELARGYMRISHNVYWQKKLLILKYFSHCSELHLQNHTEDGGAQMSVELGPAGSRYLAGGIGMQRQWHHGHRQVRTARREQDSSES